MQRLSGVDASFLYLQTAAQPLDVCSILELDTSTIPGGYTFDRLRDALALRIDAMPQFREKLGDNRFNLDHPVWLDDEDSDVNRHLQRIGLPAPGGRTEWAEVCGPIASLNLDRNRPLWEMWVRPSPTRVPLPNNTVRRSVRPCCRTGRSSPRRRSSASRCGCTHRVGSPVRCPCTTSSCPPFPARSSHCSSRALKELLDATR